MADSHVAPTMVAKRAETAGGIDRAEQRTDWQVSDLSEASLIPSRPYGDDPRGPPFQLLNKRGPGAGVLDQNAPGVPLSGKGLHGCFQGGIIDAAPPDVDEIPPLVTRQNPGRADRPIVRRSALAVSQD